MIFKVKHLNYLFYSFWHFAVSIIVFVFSLPLFKFDPVIAVVGIIGAVILFCSGAWFARKYQELKSNPQGVIR